MIRACTYARRLRTRAQWHADTERITGILTAIKRLAAHRRHVDVHRAHCVLHAKLIVQSTVPIGP